MQYSVCYLSPGSAETDNGWGGKLNSHLIAGCIKNIRTKLIKIGSLFFKLWWEKKFCVFFMPYSVVVLVVVVMVVVVDGMLVAAMVRLMCGK